MLWLMPVMNVSGPDMLPNACLQIPFALVKTCNVLSVNCSLDKMRRCILEYLYSEMLPPTSFIVLISNVIFGISVPQVSNGMV